MKKKERTHVHVQTAIYHKNDVERQVFQKEVKKRFGTLTEFSRQVCVSPEVVFNPDL